MKHRLVLSFLVAAAAVLAVGFVSRSDAASTGPARLHVTAMLRIGVVGGSTNLDGARQTDSYAVNSNALETLFAVGGDGKLRPWLAQSVTQPGRATYVYHLRHGVKFWDGNELTSTDVANALNYYRYPGSVEASYYASVKTIKAIDKYTVAVTLKHPDASWQYSLNAGYVSGIFEKKFQDAHKTTMGEPGTLVMGTGPWEVDSFTPTTGAELSANPRWWGGKVPIQHLSIKFFSDEQSMALAMRAGDLDVAFPTAVSAFAATSGAKIVDAPAVDPWILALDTVEAPWNDVHVRRAVAYALNRADISKAVGAPCTPITTVIPPVQLYPLGSRSTVGGLLKSLPQYPFSIAKAKAELAKSAHPNGVTADFDFFSYGAIPNVAQVVAAQLRKVGITLNINPLTGAQWGALILGPARDKIGVQLTTPGSYTLDPSYVPGFLLGSKNARAGHFNMANYGPPALDTLIASGLETTNPAKRLAIYGQILKKLAVDVPYIGICNAASSLAIANTFAWPTFSAAYYIRPWALEVKSK